MIGVLPLMGSSRFVDGLILQLGGTTAMRSLLLVITLIMTVPASVIAGPKEDAYQVVENFKRAFDASDVQGILNLFAPDAVFLGTVSPKLATNSDEINAYFQAIKTDTPRTVEIGEYPPWSSRTPSSFSQGWINFQVPGTARRSIFLRGSRW